MRLWSSGGVLTLWITEEAFATWHALATGKRGGQPVYSDVAIETGLALRLSKVSPAIQQMVGRRVLRLSSQSSSICGARRWNLRSPEPASSQGLRPSGPLFAARSPQLRQARRSPADRRRASLAVLIRITALESARGVGILSHCRGGLLPALDPWARRSLMQG
jgi:hypothetical protein